MKQEMTRKEMLTQYIVNEIANQLLAHYDEENPQIFFRGPRILTYQEWGGTDTPVSYAEAIEKIHEWVEKDLADHGRVFLYTCKDNQEIAVEELDRDDEDLELFERQYVPGEGASPMFYIGFD